MPEHYDRPMCCGRKMHQRGPAESGKMRYRCNICKTSTTASNAEDYEERIGLGYDQTIVDINNAEIRRLVKKGHKRFVVTAAQNNTRVHAGFAALKNYCDETGAKLLVIPVHYKNVSLYTANQQFKKTWPAELQQYLVDQRLYLGGGIEVAAELKIQATAQRPLSGMQPIGGKRWQIIGHPKTLMEPVATPSDLPPKRMYTTGAITVRNYSTTKQGAQADFHHTYGALVVEVCGRDRAFVRQIGITGESLFDIAGGKCREYGPDWVKDHDQVSALTTGDEHIKFHDKNVLKATYGPKGMATALRPECIFRHDILDGYAGSHHHEKDPVTQFKKFHSGDDDYRAELDQVVEFLNDTTPEGCTNYIVDSNHHDHLMQWLNRANANKDHRNALLIAELQAAVRAAALEGRDVPALQLYCEDKVRDTVWLDRNKPFLKNGVDYSQHGDVGVNGSRGSAASISKTTYKTVIGHSHTARIVDGCFQVGHSAGRLEYLRGMGTHTNTHCIQYPDGKRTLVDIWKGRWHL